jgi:hypothetical protein
MTSLMYVQLVGPKLSEKHIETKKIIATPALDKSLFSPFGFCELITASMIKHIVIATVPNSSGFLRPTLSAIKKMKKQSYLVISHHSSTRPSRETY